MSIPGTRDFHHGLLGMAVAIAWLPGPAGTRRRVAKLSVEEPDAAEPARPDLWGARVSNDPGLPDRWRCRSVSYGRTTKRAARRRSQSSYPAGCRWPMRRRPRGYWPMATSRLREVVTRTDESGLATALWV